MTYGDAMGHVNLRIKCDCIRRCAKFVVEVGDGGRRGLGVWEGKGYVGACGVCGIGTPPLRQVKSKGLTHVFYITSHKSPHTSKKMGIGLVSLSS